MASFVTKPRDPVLEELRNVEGPVDLEDVVTELRRETRRIHASFLFDPIGRDALVQICLFISSTRNNYMFAGWEELGIQLGLNPRLIEVILHQFKGECPTRNTLLAFIQRSDATLDKVVDALYKMERYDVITSTKQLLSELARRALESTGNTNIRRIRNVNIEESGYLSISDDQIDDDINENNIIRPPLTPVVPWIFRSVVPKHLKIVDSFIDCPSMIRESDKIQMAIPTKKKSQFGRTVLLTFASDGWDTAHQVAEVFRRQRENLPRIGVVILHEQSEYINSCAEKFVTGVFNQVDYVVPIITEEYLRTVSTQTPTMQSSLQCIDARFAKYIYSLMSTYYLTNGCINNKIRCIIPDSKVYLTQRHHVMSGPLFQVWVRESETDELSRRILRSKF